MLMGNKARLAWLQAGDIGPVQEFGALFDSVKFRKGLQLNFTSDKNGSLITQVDDQQVIPLHASLLSFTSNFYQANGVARCRCHFLSKYDAGQGLAKGQCQ